MNEPTAHRRKLTGTVVSDLMDKTVIVRIERTKIHPRYSKRYSEHRRMKAHDEKNSYHIGDLVVIEETRPISKDKRWRVIAKLSASKEKQG